MSSPRYTPEFKDEAVRQVVDRGHSVAEVAERLGVSTHSLYVWIKAVKPSKDEQQTQELNEAKKEILSLRAQCSFAVSLGRCQQRRRQGSARDYRTRRAASDSRCFPIAF